MQTTIRKPKPAFHFCGDRVVFLGLLAFSLVFTDRLHAQTNPLQIRIFNNSGTNDSMVCLYNQSGSRIKYTNSASGNEVTKVANASWPLSDIQTATDTLGRTYYPIQYVSGKGRIYFALGTNSYPGTAGSQPAATGSCANQNSGTPWNGAVDSSGNVTAPAINFDYLEMGYDGNPADEIDVTAINSQGLAMMIQLCQTANIAVSPQSLYRKGFTNTNAISTMNAGFKAVPAAPWYGGAANTNLVRFVGPSTSTPPGIVLPPGGGNPNDGWPGATNNSFAPYLYMISTSPALGINNGNKYWAVITNTVPLNNTKRVPEAVHFTYSGYWTLVNNTNPNPTSAQLTWLRGQAGGTPYYYTKTPVLTNITILASNTVTGSNKTYSNLAIRYNPDAGAPSNSVFSCYIYQAPAYTTGGSDQFITLFPSEASWSNIATDFDFDFGNGGSHDFAANVLQAIANDIAFGLAGGFVLSPVQGYAQWTDRNNVLTPPGIAPAQPLTPVTGSLTNIGKMGSQSWWLQTNLYAQLQPSSPAANPWYSQWGNVVFNATTTAYAHPIQDRMVQTSVQPQMDPSLAFNDTSYFMELYLNNAVNPAASDETPVIISPTGSVNLNNTAQGVFWQVQVVASQSPTSYDASNLPNGVQLNPATGLIQGTIPANTFYKNLNIQLWAVNTNGVGAKSTLLLTVNPPTPPGPTAPVITSETSATATQKASFTYRITASGSPTSYGATGLPAGLKVNTKNGVISGKATAAPGLYKVTLSAKNSAGVGVETLDLTVAAAGGAPAITSAGQASGEVDVYFEYQITASGNPTSYGATGLPAGITVNSRTGKISGETSRPGKYRVELSASNAQGIGRQILYLTVDPKPQPGVDITSSLATVTLQVGVLYSYTITADNSPTSYGARGLPPGLSINTRTGVISGRPSKGGDYSVTLTATHKVRGERTTVAQGTKVFLIRPFGNKTIPDNAW